MKAMGSKVLATRRCLRLVTAIQATVCRPPICARQSMRDPGLSIVATLANCEARIRRSAVVLAFLPAVIED